MLYVVVVLLFIVVCCCMLLFVEKPLLVVIWFQTKDYLLLKEKTFGLIQEISLLKDYINGQENTVSFDVDI